MCSGSPFFSTFLAPITDQAPQLLLAALLLALTAFTAISVWTLFGSAIKTQLRNPRIRLLVNSLLSLLLVYSALDVSGIIK
ncbi:MAG: hypothetical protein DWG76_03990 [Chloroflexi bacterium]|nr:hypothetical protein [Chloroflexota bacterium]